LTLVEEPASTLPLTLAICIGDAYVRGRVQIIRERQRPLTFRAMLRNLAIEVLARRSTLNPRNDEQQRIAEFSRIS
jgi:hypothetical protein